jgi:hypothetical protein
VNDQKLSQEVDMRTRSRESNHARARRLRPESLDLPEDVADADYIDVFELTKDEPDDRSPEELIRLALEESPLPIREGIRFIHRFVLRLRLAPRGAPDHVFGWRIVESTADFCRLEAESPLGGGTILGYRKEPATARVVTAIKFKHPSAGLGVWRYVGPIHRRAAPYLMDRFNT